MLSLMSYQQASIEEREKYSNGCGPAWTPKILRRGLNTIFGLNVCEACAIHDWDYAHGCDKAKADTRFYKNLKMLATQAAKDRRMLYSRHAMAWLYYNAVAIGGRFSYGKK